ncbi:MAG TPA: ABC transporter substrate-binding protein [bacterium]|nr:ABC transporter substrate-binding protein [bacterium]
MIKRNATVLFLLLAGLLVLGLAGCEKKTPGVTKTEIKIGHINPYSGPASAYGTIGRTEAAYFKMLNEEGGINGRKINFISYDDGYSPPKTVEQARKLVEQDNVLLIFQSLGTPTNSAIWQYMNDKKVPQLFVATGASKWNDPQGHPWTMGWQPNYQTEAKIYARYVVQNIPGAKIGILYQNDDYGKDYLTGFKAGLEANIASAGLSGDKAPKIVMEQSYEVSEPTIDSEVVNLKNSGANVLVNITTPKFAAQAVKKVADLGWHPTQFLNNVSISIDSVMKPAGLDASNGIISTAYLKDPDDAEWKDDASIAKWREFMQKYYPDGSLHSGNNVFGYTVAQTLVQVLKQAGDNLTRENVMKEAANLKDFEVSTLLPGIKINTSPTDFAPIEQMQLQKFDGKKGAWVRFGEVLGAN